jgi:hypothetical protein
MTTFEKTVVFIKKKIIPINIAFLQIQLKSKKENREILYNDSFRCQFHQHFYVQIFCTNVILAAFSSYIWLCAKNSYKKLAGKMLVKLKADRTQHRRRSLKTGQFRQTDVLLK